MFIWSATNSCTILAQNSSIFMLISEYIRTTYCIWWASFFWHSKNTKQCFINQYQVFWMILQFQITRRGPSACRVWAFPRSCICQEQGYNIKAGDSCCTLSKKKKRTISNVFNLPALSHEPVPFLLNLDYLTLYWFVLIVFSFR